MAGQGAGARVRDHFLEVAKGKVAGSFPVNKFGRNIGIDSGTPADIWDGGGNSGTVASKIWVAPTQARIHSITSANGGDDGSPVGVGARTIRIWYLADWDTPETFEDIVMNGVGSVAMSNAAVIINHMQVLTKGATSSNVGTIKALADTDATITSMIRPTVGQTQQLIYGIPSTQTLFVTGIFGSTNRSGGTATAIDLTFEFNPEPGSELTNFLSNHIIGFQTIGTSAFQQNFCVPKVFAGAGIFKASATSSGSNSEVTAGFCGILINNSDF